MPSTASPEEAFVRARPESAVEIPRAESLGPYSSVIAIFLCGMFAFVDLYCTQPLLPLLTHVFHASEARVSLTISASTVGVAVSAALLAMFGERLDRKRTIVSSMALLAVSTLLAATSTGLNALAFWRLVQGLLTPGIFILAITYITEEWPAAMLPRAMSVYVAGTVFGGFLGRLLGGQIAEHVGWRSVFVALGLVGICGAAITQRLLPPFRPRVRAVRAVSAWTPLVENLRNSQLLATFGIGFCMLFTLISLFSYITFYLAAAPFRLSTADLSLLFAVYLVGLGATLAAGTTLTRIGLRYGMMSAVALSLAGTLLTLVPSLGVVGLGLAVASSGVFIAQVCANSFLRDAAAAGSRVSAAGMYICAYYIGGTVGGVLPAVTWRLAGWPGCVALTCLFLVVAGLLAMFGWRRRLPNAYPVPL